MANKEGCLFATPIPLVDSPDPEIDERLSPITVEFFRSMMALQMPTSFYKIAHYVDGKDVATARNIYAQHAVDNGIGWIMFIDYDLVFLPDAFVKLWKWAHHPDYQDYDVFCGVYTLKSETGEPLIYKFGEDGELGGGPFWDWSVGDLFEVDACHMGMTLIRTSVFQRLTESNPDLPWFDQFAKAQDRNFTHISTEDLYFCQRIRKELGAKILVDSSVLCGHQDIGTGRIYALPDDSNPWKNSKYWHDPDKHKKDNFPKKALDIGGHADKERLNKEGYAVFVLGDKAQGADYCQDPRSLNLPDNAYDMVTSNHTLQKYTIEDNIEIWKELYRVTKPGGKLEIVLPNGKWSTQHINNGHETKEVYDVIYGQDRDHKMSFTPLTARDLAEASGWIETDINDYDRTPELFYHLILKAKKPPKLFTQLVTTEHAKEKLKEKPGHYHVLTIGKTESPEPLEGYKTAYHVQMFDIVFEGEEVTKELVEATQADLKRKKAPTKTQLRRALAWAGQRAQRDQEVLVVSDEKSLGPALQYLIECFVNGADNASFVLNHVHTPNKLLIYYGVQIIGDAVAKGFEEFENRQREEKALSASFDQPEQEPEVEAQAKPKPKPKRATKKKVTKKKKGK